MIRVKCSKEDENFKPSYFIDPPILNKVFYVDEDGKETQLKGVEMIDGYDGKVTIRLKGYELIDED